MFIPTTAISKIARMTKPLRIIPGGTSAGKTYSVLPLLINYATQIPALEVSVVSESLPHLRRGALHDFKKIMRDTNRWVENRFNKSTLTYTFFNGSYIEFFSCDNSEKARGPRRDILYVNECNRIKFDIFNELFARTKMMTILDFNPTHRFWVHEHYQNYKGAEWLTLTYKDNEATPKNVERLMEMAKEKAKYSSYWANWWKVYGLGQLGSLDGVIFTEGDNWEKISRVPKDARLIGYGLDWGFANDPTALVALYIYNGKKLFKQLIYEKGMLNSHIANRMLSLGVKKNVKIIADSAEPKSIAELKSYGFSIIACEKGKDSINHGIGSLQQEKFLVASSSLDTINELRNYMWEKDKKTDEKMNVPIDEYNHSIDAMRYVNSHFYGKTKQKHTARVINPKMKGINLYR